MFASFRQSHQPNCPRRTPTIFRRRAIAALALGAAVFASPAADTFAAGPTFQNAYFSAPTVTEAVADLARTSDGGSIFVGNKTSSAPPLISVAKLSQNGTREWYREYVIPNGAIANVGLQADAIRQVSDGTYIISGRYRAPGAATNGVFLLRLNADGSVRTARAYNGFTQGDLGSTAVREVVIPNPFGFPAGSGRKFAVVANTSSRRGLLVEVNENLFQTRSGVFTDATFGINTWMDFVDLRVNDDRTYTILGHVGNSDITSRQVFLMRTNLNAPGGVFSAQWARTYLAPVASGNVTDGTFAGGLDTTPSGWVFSGRVVQANTPISSFAISTDTNGLMPIGPTFWARKFPALRNAAHIRRNDLGNLIVAGQDSTLAQAALLHLGPNGIPLATPSFGLSPLIVFGGSGTDSVRAIEEAPDAGFLAAGRYGNNYYVTKLDNAFTVQGSPAPCTLVNQAVTFTNDPTRVDRTFTSVAAGPDSALTVVSLSPNLNTNELCTTRGCTNPARNLALWLPFDEGTGEIQSKNLTDATGSHDASHPAPNIAGAAGKCSSAATYGPTSASTRVNHYPEIDFSGSALTLSAWVNIPSAPGAGQVWPIMEKMVQFGGPPNKRGYLLWLARNGAGTAGQVVLHLGAGGPGININSNCFVTPNTWTRVTVAVTRQRVIVAGVPKQRFTAHFYTGCSTTPCSIITMDADTDNNATPVATGSAANLLIGGSASVPQHFLGRIDEAMIFARDLSPVEVADLCDCTCTFGCNFIPPQQSFPPGLGAATVSLSASAWDYNATYSGGGYTDSLNAQVLPTSTGISSSAVKASVPPSLLFPAPSAPYYTSTINSLTFTRGNMAQGTTAGAEVFIRSDPAQGPTPREAASCVARVYNPFYWIFDPRPTPFPVPSGQLAQASFSLRNSDSIAHTLTYRIVAARTGGRSLDLNNIDAGSLSLNALPEGTPVTGSITLPAGQSSQVSIDLLFTSTDPLGGYNLLLFGDENADGEEELLATASVVNDISAPRCIADVDDGSGTGTPDNGVTIDDLLYYLHIFEAGDINADVDDGSGTGTPDNGVTIDDLLYFLQRFEAGC